MMLKSMKQGFGKCHSESDVLKRVPEEWLPLFIRLDKSVECGNIWYRDQTSSRYNTPPLWHVLVDSVLTYDPIINDRQLQFKPRFLLLPTSLQENFLQFLQRQIAIVPDHIVREIVQGLHEHVSQDQESQVPALLNDLSKQAKGWKTLHRQDQESSGTLNETLQDLPETSGSQHSVIIVEDGSDDSQEPATKRQRLDDLSDSLATSNDKDEGLEESASCLAEVEEITFSQRRNSQLISMSFIDDEGQGQSRVGLEVPEVLASSIKDFWQNCMTDRVPENLTELSKLSTQEMQTFCKYIDFDSMTDDSVELSCQHICTLSESLSYDNIVTFLTIALGNRVNQMSQNASRKLSGAVTLAAKMFQKQFTDGVFVPCLLLCEISAGQGEIMCNVVKDCYILSTRSYALQSLLKNNFELCESKLQVLQIIIESGCDITKQGMSDLVAVLNRSSQAMAKNLKFSKLLLAIVNKHGNLLRSCFKLSEFEAVLDKHNTFLKKKIVAAVNKIIKM